MNRNLMDFTMASFRFKLLLYPLFILTLQKSKMLQIQGAKGEVVVIYCEPLATLEMWYPRLSYWVNNMVVFTIFMVQLGVNSIKAEKKSETFDHYSL